MNDYNYCLATEQCIFLEIEITANIERDRKKEAELNERDWKAIVI